ncbi:MAG: hypothetical protein NXI14_00335 [bacterium]|nr:hypothetical protein [bacterium]
MAKKHQPKPRDEGKARFELRFDEDLYAEIKRIADETEISVNQLMQGIARWAVKYAHPREEVTDFNPFEGVDTATQPGCVWFGHQCDVCDDGDEPFPINAEVFFHLDFTERRVVREPEPQPRGGRS